jgi:hypothetical protein
VAEDWRIEVELDEHAHLAALGERLETSTLERDVRRRLGDRVAVSGEGDHAFLYADTEDAAREAERVVAALAAEHGWPLKTSLTRWHPLAEEWQPADRPLPQTDAERAAERAELLADERRDTSEERYSQWEVRVTLPTLRDAHELSERLERERVPHVRRWRYVFVGATDEEAARTWEDRLRGEAPAGSEVAVEGTFAAVERNNPFAVLSALGGNP